MSLMNMGVYNHGLFSAREKPLFFVLYSSFVPFLGISRFSFSFLVFSGEKTKMAKEETACF